MAPRKTKTKEPVEEIKPTQPVEQTADLDATEEEVILPEVEASEEASGSKEKYFESVGRRKESVARVRLYTKKSADLTKEDKALITVNGKDYIDYFLDSYLLSRIESPLKRLKSLNRFKAIVMVKGGGKSGQADAVRHGLSRAL